MLIIIQTLKREMFLIKITMKDQMKKKRRKINLKKIGNF